MTGRRVVLATIGSLGDVHPYVAVGLELRRRGHRPAIATSGHWRAKVEAEGLDFAPVRPDAPDPAAMREFMGRVLDRRRGPRFVIGHLMESLRASFEDTDRAAEGADLLVGHPLTFAVRLVAESRGLPWASSVLAPASLFSSHDPPVLAPLPWLAALRPLGRRFHAPLFRALKRSTASWAEPWHALRADLGLPPTPENPIFEGQFAPDLTLALFSRQLAGPRPDWPPRTVVTGFPFFDRDAAEDATPEALDRFLEAGPPPVVFTLGSTAVWKAGRFYAESLEAARRVGCRALLLTGPEGATDPPGPLPDGVAAFRYAPYSSVFPRCSAIVHSGGVGTTAQAMRAGRPMLVVPFGFDQFDNAARVARLSAGLVLPSGRYSAHRAAAALRRLLDDASSARRAAEVGRAVRLEDGPGAAAVAIEAMLDSVTGTARIR